ncbi:hypothetical protein BpHYR1_051137, partial [Brachionus plicatilis]
LNSIVLQVTQFRQYHQKIKFSKDLITKKIINSHNPKPKELEFLLFHKYQLQHEQPVINAKKVISKLMILNFTSGLSSIK